MNTLDVLVKARELISVPERWTQGVWAADDGGNDVYVHSPVAKCFCSSGAILRAAGQDYKSKSAARGLLAKFMDLNITGFNDTHTHAEVLAAFDAAIEAERASL